MNKSFTKMQGLGNDFLVFDCTRDPCKFTPTSIRQLANRHFGVGCDQVLIIESTTSSEHAFHYRIFNADGSEVSQCGNGARCVARYAYDHQLVQQKHFKISTSQGEMILQLESDNQVTVDMGPPIFEPQNIPLAQNFNQSEINISVNESPITLHTVSMGNPHAILFVEDVTKAPVVEWGSVISIHEAFPEECNVSFAEIVDKNTIKLRVYERGVAETLACGSGACATMAVAHRTKQVATFVNVLLTGGTLQIRWKGGPTDPLFMTGTADYVFEGHLLL